MRVLVVRARDQGERTARRLAERGHEAVLAPVLATQETGAPAPDLEPAALIVTSSNAVAALVRERGRSGAVPTFAVGGRTAAGLVAAGYADVRPGSRDGAALAREIAAALPPGSTLVHACGEHGKAEPQRSLERAGYDVRRWVVYRAVAATALPDQAAEALDADRLQAALHYSRRSAEIATALVRASGRTAAFRQLAHLCLSADVAEGLAGLAPPWVAVAARPAEEALLDELARVGCGVAPGSHPGTTRC